MCLVRLSYKKKHLVRVRKISLSYPGLGKSEKNWPPLRTGELLVSMGRVCLVRFGYRTMGQG